MQVFVKALERIVTSRISDINLLYIFSLVALDLIFSNEVSQRENDISKVFRKRFLLRKCIAHIIHLEKYGCEICMSHLT